jgi:hypothetical protein
MHGRGLARRVAVRSEQALLTVAAKNKKGEDRSQSAKCGDDRRMSEPHVHHLAWRYLVACSSDSVVSFQCQTYDLPTPESPMRTTWVARVWSAGSLAVHRLHTHLEEVIVVSVRAV